jgi:hypothetical protein
MYLYCKKIRKRRLKYSINKADNEEKVYFLKENGAEIEKNLIDQTNEIFDVVIKQAHKLSSNKQIEDENKSLGEFLILKFNELVLEKFGSEIDSETRRSINGIFKFRYFN